MNSLYEIIQSLRNTSGNNDKLAILEANKDNELLKQYMKAVFDPSLNYYQSSLPKFKTTTCNYDFTQAAIDHLINNLAHRKVTGKAAIELLATMLGTLAEEGRELLGYIIKRKVADAKVGETMVLKTWPDLFFVPPYQRCRLLDDKIREHYNNLPLFYVQCKLDGSFGYMLNDNIITRQGNMYPEWFVKQLTKGVPEDVVLIGEMTVYDDCGLLDRKTGNGILNSVLQGEDESEFKYYTFHYTAWDALYRDEFKSGKSDRTYRYRLNMVAMVMSLISKPLNRSVTQIQTHQVASLEEAFEIYTKFTSQGLEGAVIKDSDGLWKDSSSGTKDAVKLKVEFEVEMEIIGYYEGEGKVAGTLGGVVVATSDRKIVNKCGSGFSDKQRKEFWEIREELVGEITTVKANDVISSKTKETLALSLPIFVEIRNDKTEADSFERVMEQLEAVKRGVK